MVDSSAHKTHACRPISEPELNTRTVWTSDTTPFIRGNGNIDLTCGRCGEVLAQGIAEGQIRNIVLQCPKCKTYNDVVWKLNFMEVKQRIGEHLKVALGVEEFEITFAKREDNMWKANVEFSEKTNGSENIVTALFLIDAVAGEVREFRKGAIWRL